MSAAATVTDSPLVLTAHPLQRAGAFAAAKLAGRPHPVQVSEADLYRVVSEMCEDLRQTISVPDTKAEGGFWLSASYLFWPNSALSHPRRKNQLPAEREKQLETWRALPGREQVIGVPCALCGQPACGFYGKVDVPLGASTKHRNTTARGQEGLPLCRGCLVSFHALPYACAVSGGRAALLHSWDDHFMAETVGAQVARMRRDAAVVVAGGSADKRPYARQLAALRRIRAYDKAITAGVDLMVFSNSNQEQTLDVHTMEQPLAEWLRLILHDSRVAAGWRYLARAHHGEKAPGLAALARNLFDRPRRVVGVAAEYLLRQAGDAGSPPGETPDLGALCSDYATKVLDVNHSDADQIRALATNISQVAGEDDSQFGKFVVATRKVGDLQRWLRRAAIDQVRYTRRPDVFVTEQQWRLLFDAGDDSFLNRDLLLIAALEKIHARDPKWRREDPAARKESDEELGEQNEEADE
jgi:hypothetical protein